MMTHSDCWSHSYRYHPPKNGLKRRKGDEYFGTSSIWTDSAPLLLGMFTCLPWQFQPSLRYIVEYHRMSQNADNNFKVGTQVSLQMTFIDGCLRTEVYGIERSKSPLLTSEYGIDQKLELGTRSPFFQLSIRAIPRAAPNPRLTRLRRTAPQCLIQSQVQHSQTCPLWVHSHIVSKQLNLWVESQLFSSNKRSTLRIDKRSVAG